MGYNWGAGEYGRVKAIEKRCFLASAILSVAAAAVIFLFPKPLAGLFMQDADAAFYEMAVPALMLFSLTYITRWISFATQSLMSAIEKPIQASMISLSTALVFPLLFIAVLWPMGLNGLWLNLPATALLAALLSLGILLHLRRFLQKKQKTAE